MHSPSGLRTVAVFEAAKGLLVLVVGFGLLGLLHQDAQAFAERIVLDLHLNPSSRYPRIFLELVDKATPPRLLLLAAGAMAYAAVRFVEAYGLWRSRAWAEWFAALSGGIYLPLEVWELWKEFTGLRLTILIVNLVVVLYLARLLRQQIMAKRTLLHNHHSA